MRVSIDIETACANAGCTDKRCDHALYPHTNRITLISVWAPTFHKTFRSAPELRHYLNAHGPFEFVTHYGVFDLAVLSYHGCDISRDQWALDTQFMAAVSLTKIPATYLSWYGEYRKVLNEARTTPHRDAGQYSLKTLAPYFLDVPAFWEPEDHDDVEYNLRDTEYTYRLSEFFEARLREEGLHEFFINYQMRWARGLLRMSLRGVDVDLQGLAAAETQSAENAAEYKAELDRLWAPAYQALVNLRTQTLVHKYDEMLNTAIEKAARAKKPPKPGKYEQLRAKYTKLRDAALIKMDRMVNLGSTDQLSWILRDYFGLDIRDWEDEESTAKAVIQKLIGEGREDLRVLLDWRTEAKRLSSFYPTYRKLMRPTEDSQRGRLHTTFNPTGARTGRISSSRPNLQQCPPHVRGLFVAPPGFELATYDMSAIEPRLIAYYSEDKTLFDLLESGADFHGFNTKVFFGLDCDANEVKHLYPRERKVGKEAGLSILYGAGARRLQNIALKYGFTWSLDECKRKIAALRGAYPGVTAFKRSLDEMARTQPVTGYFGQKYAYPDPEDIYMKGFNTTIQGSASQIVVESKQRIQEEFDAEGIPGGPILVVHDEIVNLVVERGHPLHDRSVEIIKHRMVDWPLPTPHGNVRLEVEGAVSKRWEK